MTVESMRASMTNFEFMQWQAYYGRKNQREDLQAKMAKRGK